MTRRPALAALGAAVLTGSAAIAWASLIERNLFTLRHHELPVLAPGSSPVRVLHLSDLHLVPGQDRKVGWVRDLARLEPDLVVNTGDNLAHLQAVPTALSAMAPLLERPGVFVLGSNDYFGPHLKNPALYLTRHHRKGLGRGPELPTQDLIDGFTSAGWHDLTHRRERLEVAGRAFELLGVDDPHLERDRYDLVAGPADPSADLTIGVTHAPYQRTLNAMTADGAGLVLAGHTHGGQLCIPGYGALVTNCDLDTGRVSGVSRWWPGAGSAPSSQAPGAAAWLHVCAGLGTSPYAPVRLACRPEAALLTLTAR